MPEQHQVTQKKNALINYEIGNQKNLREERRFARIHWNLVT